jgi:serine/threonine protein kinase
MIRRDGDVWLVDFGNSVVLDADVFDVGGTHGYAPPEQYTPNANTVRSDIYALGATLFEMCVMRVPHQGHDGNPRTPQFPADVLVNMDRRLRAIGQQMVKLEPDQRPANMSAVLTELAPMLPQPGDPRHPKAPDPDPAEWYRNGRHLTHRAP